MSAPTRGRTLDYAASVYDWLSPLMTFGHEKKMGQIALELMEIKGHEKIIDIGCGTGTLTLSAGQKLSADKGGHIIGIDAAAKMIALARKKIAAMPQVRFDVSAAEKLGYQDESFDLALSTFFFHHIDIELKLAALNEIWRVLKKGGKAVIVDVDIPTTLFGKICAWSGYILFHQEEIRENIEGKLRAMMRQSHFGHYQFISSHLGYVSIFVLQKGS
jgi:ubiquinone/menaquinone biosynthesis C-methylase UbiE